MKQQSSCSSYVVIYLLVPLVGKRQAAGSPLAFLTPGQGCVFSCMMKGLGFCKTPLKSEATRADVSVCLCALQLAFVGSSLFSLSLTLRPSSLPDCISQEDKSLCVDGSFYVSVFLG